MTAQRNDEPLDCTGAGRARSDRGGVTRAREFDRPASGRVTGRHAAAADRAALNPKRRATTHGVRQ
jgi:hypothetical protein